MKKLDLKNLIREEILKTLSEINNFSNLEPGEYKVTYITMSADGGPDNEETQLVTLKQGEDIESKIPRYYKITNVKKNNIYL